MTLTRSPVEADSSVTDWPFGFATQMCAPAEVMLSEPLSPYLAPRMTFTRVPVDAEISVTDLPRFATQTWVPSAVMAHGSSNPHPSTLTPESGLTDAADAETREALSHTVPAADVGVSVTRVRPDTDRAPTATVRRNRPEFALIDGPPQWTKVHHIVPISCHGPTRSRPAGSQPLLPKGPVIRSVERWRSRQDSFGSP